MSATDVQMQTFADRRIRVRAEQARALIDAMRDDKLSIDSAYDRAANGSAWGDARTDGPPKLLASQDFLTYNAVISLFDKVVLGTATTQDVADLHANWATFQAACVQPIRPS